MKRTFKVGSSNTEVVEIGKKDSLVFIGGPCAIENEKHTLMMAENMSAICRNLSIPFIFKSCFNKDCRSSVDSFMGVGLEEGLRILEKVQNETGVPVTTDVSNAAWIKATAEVVDLLQIPAYLCRQTHLLIEAAQTQKPINLKKGQFMSPWNMRNSCCKIESTGNHQIMLTDRGTFFGYNSLVSDFRSLKIMAETGYPVCYDATHSIQMPTSLGTLSGGQREFIPMLVRSACASGVDALFMEVHDQPDQALSDPATQLDLKYLEMVLSQAARIHALNYELIHEFGEDCVE